MNPVDLHALQRILTAHGTPDGATYFDAEESIVHDVFTDRIVFQTNFSDYSTYTVAVADGDVRVSKTRLDNFKRGHNAQVIDDEMDDDDWEELTSLWQRLSQDLDTDASATPVDVVETLTDLFYCLFDEERAQALVDLIPAATGEWDWAWTQIEAALAGANQVAHFEWKEWPSYGVEAINALAPLQALGVEIPMPDDNTIAVINSAADWERALLQYFNKPLEAHDLKVVALGTHFDESQAFALLPMNGLGLANALELMGRLRIVHKY